MVFCNKCDTENPDSAKFCSNCGSDLSDISDKETPVESKSCGFSEIMMWIFGIILILGGIFDLIHNGGSIGGLLILLGGVIMIPRIGNLSGELRLVICFALMISGGLLLPPADDGTSNANMATQQGNSNIDAKLITKSEEEMSLTIDDMPLGWTGSKGKFKYIQSGDIRTVDSKVTKYSSVEEAKEAYQNLMPENTATISVNFGDEGVGLITVAGLNIIIFRKDNVVVKIVGYSECHTLDMTDIEKFAKAVEKKM